LLLRPTPTVRRRGLRRRNVASEPFDEHVEIPGLASRSPNSPQLTLEPLSFPGIHKVGEQLDRHERPPRRNPKLVDVLTPKAPFFSDPAKELPDRRETVTDDAAGHHAG
jgi:hypothetical protein